MTARFISTAVAAVLAAAVGNPVAAQSIPQHEGHYHEGEFGEKYLLIEQNLRCNCGCNLDLHSCQYQMQCGTSPVWSQRIRRELEEGKTPEAIEAGFVAEFGPTVLLTPPAEGFNLVGYLLPGMAILTAGVLVGLIARGGMRVQPAGAGVAREVSEAEEARLRAALKELDEAESPDW